MRSVHFKILLWCFATLLLSLVAFVLVSAFVSGAAARGGFITDLRAWQTAEAAQAYESGGAAGLSAYLGRQRLFLKERDYLTDTRGRDLLTDEDRSALLKLARPASERPQQFNGHMVMVTPSVDNRYRLITVADPPIAIRSLLPYYFLILVAVGLVCWMLALNIASPLRDLARAVDRFGRGELDVRLNSRRKDEIGELSRSFDRMAERIGTLLTAERRLLQDISHELRSPLARLSFAAELTRTAPDRNAAAERLKKEIDRLTDLVGALVEVTRAEGDPPATRLEPLHLGDLLRVVVEDCRVDADARGCGIGVNGDLDQSLRGDRELLRRAVENVVRNAIRYTPRGSIVDVKVDVKMENAGQTVRISVRDSGPGVPEELLPKIFQPFFRADDSRDSSTGGVGLGLAIASRAISVHHGRLWARNENPGLCVCLELPLAV
jgi:signal transduction histidine kinase